MIIKDNTNERIERRKARLGLTGDVYIYNDHYMESLESHKNLIPESEAETIEEAYEERVAYELWLGEQRSNIRNNVPDETENEAAQ